MNSKINISLPSPLKKWVEKQVAKKGYSTANEFVVEMLRREQKSEVRERIDALLIESLESGEATPMTIKDWTKIREEGRKRFQARRKK